MRLGEGAPTSEDEVESSQKNMAIKFTKAKGVAVVVVALEILFCFALPHFISYTEIDWKAYMSEVEGPFKHGIWDYMHLRGTVYITVLSIHQLNLNIYQVELDP